jgi:hypothetical protein
MNRNSYKVIESMNVATKNLLCESHCWKNEKSKAEKISEKCYELEKICFRFGFLKTKISKELKIVFECPLKEEKSE